MANWLLVLITAVYAGLTYWIIRDNRRVARLAANPIVGIRVDDIVLGKAFWFGERRQLSMLLTVANIGDSAAVNVVFDGELEFSHNQPQGEKRLPARFTHSAAFLRAGEESQVNVGYFGRRAVDGLLADFQEAIKLNEDRIENDPHNPAIDATMIRVFAYYANNLGQSFASTYESYISMWDQPEPSDDNEIHFVEVTNPRFKFHSEPVSEGFAKKELERRDAIRSKGGS